MANNANTPAAAASTDVAGAKTDPKADPKASAKAKTSAFTVLVVPIQHDGASYAAGSTIQLTAAGAERLAGLVAPKRAGADGDADDGDAAA